MKSAGEAWAGALEKRGIYHFRVVAVASMCWTEAQVDNEGEAVWTGGWLRGMFGACVVDVLLWPLAAGVVAYSLRATN